MLFFFFLSSCCACLDLLVPVHADRIRMERLHRWCCCVDPNLITVPGVVSDDVIAEAEEQARKEREEEMMEQQQRGDVQRPASEGVPTVSRSRVSVPSLMVIANENEVPDDEQVNMWRQSLQSYGISACMLYPVCQT